MTIDELIKELSELSERGFSNCQLRTYIPILYTDKDGNLMQLTTLNSEPKYEPYFDYYSITISNLYRRKNCTNKSTS